MADELDNTIRENARGSKRAAGDSGSVEQHNRRHWANADALSADAAASAAVRRTLRNRARYEVANNPARVGAVAIAVRHTRADSCRRGAGSCRPGQEDQRHHATRRS